MREWLYMKVGRMCQWGQRRPCLAEPVAGGETMPGGPESSVCTQEEGGQVSWPSHRERMC